MRSSRPVVTGVLVFTLEVGLTGICLNKVCMVVWTMTCTRCFYHLNCLGYRVVWTIEPTRSFGPLKNLPRSFGPVD